MTENQFVVTDIDFDRFGEDAMTKSEPAIVKEENIKDDDILLFTQAEMDELQNGSAGGFEIVDTIGAADTASFNIPFSDDQLNQLMNMNTFNSKMHFDMFATKMNSIKQQQNDGNFSHFVKYKVQDGKHTKVWQCGICSKEFGHQYILMRHLPTHTDERKFQCNTCGKGNLRNHIFTHTNERPYKCDVCSKGFNQMSNLMCHKLKAHQRADKPRYTCQSCGKEFQKRMGLRNHEQYEHGDKNGHGSSSNGIPRIRCWYQPQPKTSRSTAKSPSRPRGRTRARPKRKTPQTWWPWRTVSQQGAPCKSRYPWWLRWCSVAAKTATCAWTWKARAPVPGASCRTVTFLLLAAATMETVKEANRNRRTRLQAALWKLGGTT